MTRTDDIVDDILILLQRGELTKADAINQIVGIWETPQPHIRKTEFERLIVAKKGIYKLVEKNERLKEELAKSKDNEHYKEKYQELRTESNQLRETLKQTLKHTWDEGQKQFQKENFVKQMNKKNKELKDENLGLKAQNKRLREIEHELLGKIAQLNLQTNG